MKDPIKIYFQEKAANLFLRKEIVKIFIEEDNKNKTNQQEPVQILSNSFLNFSELRDVSEKHVPTSIDQINLPSSKFVKKTLVSEREIISNYDKGQMNKKIDMIMMVKVNDQMVNQETDKKADFSNRLIKFEKNDSLIASNLESQTSNVNSRLVQRKMNSKIRC